MSQLYPKWRFHPSREAFVVKNAEEEETLSPESDGWVNHPDQFGPPPLHVIPQPGDAEKAPDPEPQPEPPRPLAPPLKPKPGPPRYQR